MPLTDEQMDAMFGAPSRAAKTQNAASVEADPDEAARTLQLSTDTGVPQGVIRPNQKEFESAYKTKLGNDIIDESPHLQSYVNANPLHASISNDDWGNLANLSDALKTMYQNHQRSFVGQFVEGFGEGFGKGGPGSWQGDIPALGMTEHPQTTYEAASHMAWTLLGFVPEAFVRTVGGIVEGTGKALPAYLQSQGLDEQEATRLGRDLTGMVQQELTGFGVHRMVPTEGLAAPKTTAEVAGLTKDNALKLWPFLRGKKEPPTGVLQIVDQMKKEQANNDVEVLNEVEKAHDASNTAERSPQAMAAFLSLSESKSTVSITADGLRHIYGEDMPMAGDGKLGDAEGVVKGYSNAVSSDTAVSIPIDEWLKIPKEVRDELREHKFAVDGGISKDQAKNLPEIKPHPESGEGMPTVLKDVYGLHPPPIERPGQIHTLEGVVDIDKLPLHQEEKVGPAAIRIEDDIYTGRNHAEAVDTAVKHRGIEADELLRKVGDDKDLGGFVTSYGRYVDREEASKIALEQDQVQERERHRGGPQFFAELMKEQAELPLESKAKPVKELAKDIQGTIKNAFGKQRYERWEKRNVAQTEAEVKWLNDREAKEIRLRETKEWKEMEDKIRDEVESTLDQRPDVAVDNLLRHGIIDGQKTGTRPKIFTEKLTPEQYGELSLLEPDFISEEKGYNPDDLASLFGYKTGNEMIEDLINNAKVRRQNNLGPKEWRNEIRDNEVNARIEAERGETLEERIFNEAADFATRPEVMSRVHEELMGAGEKAGASAKAEWELKQIAKTEFDDTPVNQHSSSKYLEAATRASQKAEDAMLKGKWTDAFKYKQFEYLSRERARLAKQLENTKRKFDRLMDRLGEREPTNMPAEYANFAHQIMFKINKPVDRSLLDLQKALEHAGYKDLDAFHLDKTSDLEGKSATMEIADFLMDPQWNGIDDVDKLTAAEYKAVYNSFVSLVHNAKVEYTVANDKVVRQRAELKKEMIDTINARTNSEKALPMNPNWVSKGNAALQAWKAQLLQAETIMNWWDRDNHLGIFNQFIALPAASAAYRYLKMGKEIAEDMRALRKFEVGWNDRLDNRLIIDANGNVAELNRGNLIRIMLNYGNEDNWGKIVKGEAQLRGSDPKLFGPQLEAWIHKNATENDWKFVQGMFDIFDKIADRSDKVDYEQSGVPVERIPKRPMDTRFGTFEGGYSPMIYDKQRLKPGATEKPPEIEHFRASTPSRFRKNRTPYYGPVNLQMDSMPFYMSQMLHDVAFRGFVREAGKILHDNDIRALTASKFGDEYRNIMRDWLIDVGNKRNFDTANAQRGAALSDYLRTSLTTSLISINPYTWVKHGSTAAVQSMAQVGAGNFTREFLGMLTNQMDGEAAWSFAKKHGREIQNRHNHWATTIGGASDAMLEKMSWPQAAAYYGSYPIAFFDMASALPTWTAAYKQEMYRLMKDGQGAKVLDFEQDPQGAWKMAESPYHTAAVEFADRAVRQAHGSTIITSQPEMVRRASPTAKWFLGLFGFWNHMFQRDFTLIQQFKDLDVTNRFTHENVGDATMQASKLAFKTFAYFLAPGLVEELLTPYTNEEHKSWVSIAARSLFASVTGTMPYVRELAHSFLESTDPSAGLVSTEMSNLVNLYKDTQKKDPLNARNVGNLINHTGNLVGAMTGTPAVAGRMAKFWYRQQHGLEKPEGVIQGPWSHAKHRSWIGGMIRGTAEYPRNRR